MRRQRKSNKRKTNKIQPNSEWKYEQRLPHCNKCLNKILTMCSSYFFLSLRIVCYVHFTQIKLILVQSEKKERKKKKGSNSIVKCSCDLTTATMKLYNGKKKVENRQIFIAFMTFSVASWLVSAQTHIENKVFSFDFIPRSKSNRESVEEICYSSWIGPTTTCIYFLFI